MASSKRTVIGVIGGSGLYDLEGLSGVERLDVSTPFGAPSDSFLIGQLFGHRMVFLPRHGRRHSILPHEINFRANIWALKKLGVEILLSVSAVGSMKEEIHPGHLVLVDQFIDLTKRRISTFFGEGIVAHVPMADPVCNQVREALVRMAKKEDILVHDGGSYVCIDGPQFSSRAESKVYRSWGVSVIGMTNMPEAKLAREAEMAYATIALATDYDCWHAGAEDVSVEAVLKTLSANVEKAKRLIRAFAQDPEDVVCPSCCTAARSSLLTLEVQAPERTRRDLAPILSTFWTSRP